MKKFGFLLAVTGALFSLVAAPQKAGAQAAPPGAPAPFTAYANSKGEVVVSRGTQEYARFGWLAWGPNWGWTALSGAIGAQNGVASGELSGKLSNSPAQARLRFSSRQLSPRVLQIEYALRTSENTALTLITTTLAPGVAFNGSTARLSAAAGEKSVKFPWGRGDLGNQVSRLELSDGDGRVTTARFDPPVNISSDGAARLELARDSLNANEERKVTIALELPETVQWYAGASEVPNEPGFSAWYPWMGTGSAAGSMLGMEEWNDAPAGRAGRITRRGNDLIYNGAPIKLWGLNLSYSAPAPEKSIADKRAALYRRYGINSVRLHKWADGPGWSGIQSQNSAVEFDPAALDRFDYQVAKFKEAGIYVKLSAVFGAMTLAPKEKESVPWLEELGEFRNNRIRTPHSAVHYSPELQGVLIEQMLNMLKHRNPYTGLTYAQDPTVAFVEIINEQSILFWSSMDPLKRSPTLRRQVGQRFGDWLRAKYKNAAGLEAAWGKESIDFLKNEVRVEGGESLDRNTILPLGNPWYWDPTQLNGQLKPQRQRLLDTLEFLTQLQDAFYARYVKAMREAGYEGEMVSSNWVAGRAYSHFANLHSDAQIGTIDRHNYFGRAAANASMLARAGSGLLSSGMTQVADRPFMLSEWIHEFPNQYAIEGPAILGAYGMGLQGWDVSYVFQNADEGGFLRQMGRENWEVTSPTLLGVFPAVARQVRRGDVAQSEIVAPRNVHFPSLFQGQLGFDDQYFQDAQNQELNSSTVPVRSLAVVRNEVVFTPTQIETPKFDIQKYMRGNTLVSSTKELEWTESSNSPGGFFTINTSATKAVVGFAQDLTFNLGQITIVPQNRFAAIYVTARDPKSTLDNSKDILIVAMSRARNTGQKFSPDGREMLVRGDGPILMEPVKARIRLAPRAGQTPRVFALDHDGRLTETTIPVQNGFVEIDAARDKTPYYLVRYP